MQLAFFIARRFLLVVLLGMSIFLPAYAASTPDVPKGLSWLQAQVQTDGSLKGEAASIVTPLQARSETLVTLNLLATVPTSLAASIAASTADNTEHLARLAIALSLSGQNAAPLMSTLASRQSSDGGFGSYAGFESNPLDTAWALLAMVQNGGTSSLAAGAARTYIAASISSDGGVTGLSDYARVQAGALTLLALQASQSNLSIATIVKNLTSWLLQRQGADGGWFGNTYLSAETYGALAPLVSDPAVRASASGFLAAEQDAGGSWAQDTFLTAIALRALSSAPAAPPAPGTLSGQVLDANAGTVLPGATVTLSGAANTQLTTGSDGRFTFPSLAAGNYGLQIAAPGYETRTANYTLNAGQTIDTGAILLKPSATTGIVRGQAVDGTTGQPLPGVAIALSGAASLNVLTDASGQFLLTGVPAGTITLSASLTGYQTINASGTVTAGQTLNFTPVLYPNGATVPGSGRIFGQVTAQGSGSPLSGVGIEVNGSAAGTTASDGRFDLTLPAAAYTLRFTLTGYADATLTAILTGGANLSTNITLAPQQSATTIHGTVTDQATAKPIAGAQVQLIGGTAVLTGADGSYTLSGLSGTVFNLRASATGYASQAVQLQTAQPTDLIQDFALTAQTGTGLDLGPLTISPASAGSRSDIGISAIVSNNAATAATAVPMMTVQDPQGKVIGKAYAYDATGTHMLGSFQLAAGAQQAILFRWNTAQFAPGTYTFIGRLVEAGTISTGNPTGTVLVERQTAGAIIGDAHITGTVTADPPVLRANTSTVVHLTAALQNDGNTELPAQTYQAQIVNASTHALTATVQADGAAFAPGQLQTITFPDWTPTDGADYTVTVSAAQTPSLGSASTTVHVGEAATANFAVDKPTVPTGTQKVRGTLHVTGQDALTGSSGDPLLPIIKSAIQKGVTYNDARAASFTLSNNCTGCHVQTQALVGGELTKKLTTYDHAQRNIILNVLTLTQQSNGALDGYGGYQQVQNMLGLWALTSVENKTGILSTLVKSADFSVTQQQASGSWMVDRSDAWWAGLPTYTPFNVKSLIEVTKTLQQTAPAGADDYALSLWSNSPNVTDEYHATSDAAGNTYIASRFMGIIYRVTPAGQTSTFMTISRPRELLFAPDGSLYIATDTGLKHRKLDGSVVVVNSETPNGVALGPDGNVYMSSASRNAILQITPQDVTTTYIDGNGLNVPYGIAFTPAGELLVANYGGSNIVKYHADKTYEAAVGWIWRPYFVKPHGNEYLVTTDYGLFRFDSDGVGERLLYNYMSGSDIYLTPTDDIVVGYGSRMMVLTKTPRDANAELASYRTAIQKGVDWLLNDANYDNRWNMTEAHRLIGLGSARAFYDGQPIASTIQAKMEQVGTLLRSHQLADGGWGAWTSQVSDSMVTAMVGLALDTLNPPAQDPAIRKAVQLLLNRQQADGSWISEDNIMSQSNLGPTTWVAIWLPIALDRLGGIDTALTLTTPANVTLANLSFTPNATQTNADGSTTYRWAFTSVKSAGVDIGFDLTLPDMTPGEQRPVATEAYLTFNNSFTQQPITAPIDIPVVKASSYLDLAVATDKPRYGADTPVDVTATVTNLAAVASSGAVTLAIQAADGTQVADLGKQPFAALAPGADLPLYATWNTGAYATGTYTLTGTLYDDQDRQVGQASATFDITGGSGSSLVAPKIGTDKASYLPTDTVKLTDRIANLTQNQALDNLTVRTTVYRPDGGTHWTQTATLPQLLPNSNKTLGYNVNLAMAPVGAYRAVLAIEDIRGTTLATGETAFTVRSTIDSGAGLKGSIGAQPKEVEEGSPVTLTAQIDNLGNADLARLPINVTIIDPATQKEIVTWPATADIAQQHSYQTGASWSTHASSSASATINNGQSLYIAILTATVNGQSITLASDTFTVKPKPSATNGLAGSITASPKTVTPGATLSIAAVATNQGSADAVGQALQVAIVDPASGATLASWPYTATIGQGKRYAMTPAWTASGTPGTTYNTILSATVNGKSVTLATDSFTLGGVAGSITDIPAMTPWQTALLILIMLALGAYVGSSKLKQG